MLIRLVVAVLLFSAGVPCGLLEIEAEPICTGGDSQAVAGDAPAGDLHLDCCAGCLTCCARYTGTAAAFPPVPAPLITALLFFPAPRPPVASLPIWHPPRS
jgi:hypothetical protein